MNNCTIYLFHVKMTKTSIFLLLLKIMFCIGETQEPLYNMLHYNTALYDSGFKDTQNIENDHLCSFFYIINTS